MQKKISFMIVLVLLLSVFPKWSVKADINVDTSKYKLCLESENLRLYMDDSSLSIKIEDKEGNYVWSSDREFAEDERINNVWRNRINSGVTVEYYNPAQSRNGIATILGDKAKVDVKRSTDEVSADVFFESLKIGFSLKFRLQNNILTIELPYESLREEDMLIKNVSLFPFLGSTGAEDNDGYILIPDGSGALIEYGLHDVKISDPYKTRVYGADFGMNNYMPFIFDYSDSDYNITVPLYGMVNGVNKNAFYSEAEKGSAYADIFAYPVGVTLNYNWAGFIFNYRQNFFQPTGNDGGGYSAVEEEKSVFDIKLNLTFLNKDNANYTGIARDYQSKLVDRGVLRPKVGNSFVNLDIIGAEVERNFIWKNTRNYTDTKEVKDILNDLLGKGINPTVNYIGYYKGGNSTFPLNKSTFESKLGSQGDFKDLASFATSNNIPLYFAANYLKTDYETGGISKTKDFLRKVDRKVARINTWLANSEYVHSYLNYPKFLESFNSNMKAFAKLHMNVTIADAGRILYSDYGINMNREQAREFLENNLYSENVKTAFSMPNSYVWRATDRYFNMSMSSSKYSMFTKDVPFLQIMLKGYIDLYSDSMNKSGDLVEDRLRLIEYGVYPSYVVTKESPVKLIGTPLEYVFSSEYEVWKDKIAETTNMVKEALEPVVGCKVVKHESFGKLSVTVYDNGIQIVVNYSEKPQVYNGIEVKGLSYSVSEVKSK